MDVKINKLDEIWTSDGVKLGVAQTLFHRQKDINPELLYYASYLEVESYELGSDYFIPTDFIAGRDAASGRITLAVSMNDVMERTWFRRPQFIAHAQAEEEKLAIGD